MTHLERLTRDRAECAAKLEAIDKEIAALPKEWPQVGDHYYYVGTDGSIGSFGWCDDNADRSIQTHGNIFPTLHAAEQHAKRLRLMAEARAEGMVNWLEFYFYYSDEVRSTRYDARSVDMARFRSGNYARTREAMEDKVRRYGARFILGYDDEEGE